MGRLDMAVLTLHGSTVTVTLHSDVFISIIDREHIQARSSSIVGIIGVIVLEPAFCVEAVAHQIHSHDLRHI